jgi:undecaprenyl diphosphate synthase
MSFTKEQIIRERIPRHIAVIMDGNGRWAKQKGFTRVLGHKNGVKAVREITEASAALGIQYLTLYVFSTENWNRPKEEVYALMQLLVRTIRAEIDTFQRNNIQLKAIGNLEKLPKDCIDELQQAMQLTEKNTGMNLVLALSYSGRWEIMNAVKMIAQDVKKGVLNPEQIDDTVFNEYLHTSHIPDPELIIRTSGEMRISNFLLWQLAYSELFFTDILWPDFRKENLYEALVDYQNRERRFGKTGEQIK